MAHTITPGTRVRFELPLCNGGMCRFTARVVRVDGEIAVVEMPRRVRRMPFAPGGGERFLLYLAAKLQPAIVK